MTRFTREYPGVEIIIQEETTAQLLKLAEAYEIDFAIASHPIRDERLEIVTLFAEELLLALPPNHPLIRRRGLTVADLETERLIVMKEGHCLGDQVLRFCDRGPGRPGVSFRSAQLETIQALVRAGLGISALCKMRVRTAPTLQIGQARPLRLRGRLPPSWGLRASQSLAWRLLN